MHLDFTSRELTVKLVYYGPALSGKTTNLRSLHGLIDESSRGRLMTLETKDDRTLFFDLLPMSFAVGNLSLRVKVFTVPGQALHAATRRLVLQGVDGVVFVADSQRAETANNRESFLDLRENIKHHGAEFSKVPIVIQFNKRDLPEVIPEAELTELARRGKEPVFLGVASEGQGVVETFLGTLQLTLERLETLHGLGENFGMDHARIVQLAAARLGFAGGIEKALQSCLGAAFERGGHQ